MRFRASISALVAVAWLGLGALPRQLAAAPAHFDELRAATTTEYHLLPMRDGARLFTVVMRPKGSSAPAPVILVRTPYNANAEANIAKGLLSRLASRGYVIIVQNERGSLLSEGEFHLMGGARRDGYDTLDWIARQKWSNGRVGTMGCSSSGDNQIPLAAERHPAHAAMLTMSSGTAFLDIPPFYDRGGFYRGGVIQGPWFPWYAAYGLTHQLRLPMGADEDVLRRYGALFSSRSDLRRTPGADDMDFRVVMNTLPLAEALRRNGGGGTDLDAFVRRLPNDPAWDTLPHFREGDQLGVPGLWIMHQYDIGIDGMMAGFEYVLRTTKDAHVRRNQFAVVGALGHCSYLDETEQSTAGERPVGDARFDYEGLVTSWFDHWLSSPGKPGDFRLPRVQLYVPGSNRWRAFDAWPAPAANARQWFLASQGRANSRLGDGVLVDAPAGSAGSDTFRYDPAYPVPTNGGTICCVEGANVQPGAFDQSALELRTDVLVYTSEPLAREIEVVGWGEAVVHLSSDAPDTDLSVKVVDVSPDGVALNVGESIQRVRWRDGYAKPALMRRGEVYAVRVGPFFVSNRFDAGHRLRIEVSSSNFPGWERNLNTGGNNFDESSGRVATNTVHHSRQHPSRLILPVLPARSAAERIGRAIPTSIRR